MCHIYDKIIVIYITYICQIKHTSFYVDYLDSEYEEMKEMLDDFAERYGRTTEHERRFSNNPNDEYFAFLIRLATFILSEEKLINSQEMRLDRKNGRLRVHKTISIEED